MNFLPFLRCMCSMGGSMEDKHAFVTAEVDVALGSKTRDVHILSCS